jgi:N2-acetyl-L-2,4-diaminobutanoate deacetylase
MLDSALWRFLSPRQIDSARLGKQSIAVRLGYEREGEKDELLLPLVMVHHGRGPAVLVVGGTHGDEFEGQMAVSRLCREIDPENIQGTLILLPLHNVLACHAGTRHTPGDGSDLNRLYGQSGGPGPAQTIARFVENFLLPQVDWVIDLHSGGVAHEFVLSSNLQARPHSPEFNTMLRPLLALDAPYAIVFDEVSASGQMPHTGTLEGLARKLGKKAISSELGGGGRLTPASLGVAEHGLRSLLSFIGVVPWRDATPPEQSRSQLLFLGRPEHYVSAPAAGRFAPLARLGEAVQTGDLLGTVAPLHDPLAKPEPVIASSHGIVIAIAQRGLQQSGDGLFYLADELDWKTLLTAPTRT